MANGNAILARRGCGCPGEMNGNGGVLSVTPPPYLPDPESSTVRSAPGDAGEQPRTAATRTVTTQSAGGMFGQLGLVCALLVVSFLVWQAFKPARS